MCAWVPAGVGESGEGQKDTKGLIDRALDRSTRTGDDGDTWGPGRDIVRDRPKGLFNHLLLNSGLVEEAEFLLNAFCPTGPGGGVDPTCGSGQKAGGEGSLPKEPTFVSKQGANVEQNIKAVAELKQLALAGDLVGLQDHPGTPSPKVQAYKQALMEHVQSEEAKSPIVKSETSSTTTTNLPDPADLTHVKSLPGSTSPDLMQDASGKQWVVKSGEGTMPKGGTPRIDHIKNEADFDAAYRAAGIDTPQSGIVGGSKVAEYLEGKSLAQWEKTASAEDIKSMNAKMAEGFAADALFGNRDVFGLNKDNILIVGDKPYRIDNGATGVYRAQGEKKDFGTTPQEVATLRNPSFNPTGAQVYGALTDKDIASQVAKLDSNREAILKSFSNTATRDAVEKRLDWLKEKYPSTQSPTTQPTSAKGIASSKALTDALKDNKELKFTETMLKKFAHLNPNGIENGTINVPYLHSNKAVAQAKLEELKKVLPEGTGIKMKYHITAKLVGSGGDVSSVTKATKEETKEALSKATTIGVQKEGTYEFKSASALSSNHVAWTETLTTGESAAVNSWKGLAKDIRQNVADSITKGTALNQEAKDFLSAIDKVPPYKGDLFRGINSTEYADQIYNECLKSGIGGKWADVSPMGMSRHPKTSIDNFSNGNLVLSVKVKTARPIEPEDGHKDEAEIIGMPGKQYRIMGITEKATLKYKGYKSGKPNVGKTATKRVIHLEEIE